MYEFATDRVELNYAEAGLNEIARLIEQRVEVEAVFEQRELLLEMAKASGGHVRHLMQIMRAACIHALGLARAKIQADNVTYAINQHQFQFERSTPRAYYGELARIAQQKTGTMIEPSALQPELMPLPGVSQAMEPTEFLGLNLDGLRNLATFAQVSQGFTLALAEVSFAGDADILLEALQNRPECEDLHLMVVDFSGVEVTSLLTELMQRLAQQNQAVPGQTRPANSRTVSGGGALPHPLGVSGLARSLPLERKLGSISFVSLEPKSWRRSRHRGNLNNEIFSIK
ncbi:MAG: hypothetical protein F6K30_26325 [Cyanothece sp. SIO2G6]|nr:hypothetical protein [Cyanothece sp. SIO2G6]